MKSHLLALRTVFRFLAALLAFAAVLFTAANTPAANTTNVYVGASPGSLLTAGNWSLGAAPTAANDAVFDGTVAPGIFTLSAGSLTMGSLNVTTNAGIYSIRNETTDATVSILTLGGGCGRPCVCDQRSDVEPHWYQRQPRCRRHGQAAAHPGREWQY